MAVGKKPRRRPIDPALGELLADAEAVQDVLRTPPGKRMMRYLHRKVNVRSTFVPGDPHAMAIREGMRVLYLHIRWLGSLASEDLKKKFDTIKDQSVWEQTRDVESPEELSEGDY